MTPGARPQRLAVILKGYPRLSETFIAQELLALEQAGLPLTLFSLRHPTDKKLHPVNQAIQAPVVYLPEYLYQEPRRVLRAWWRQRRQAGYRQALRAFWRDLRRDRSANRWRRFGQALVLANEMPVDVGWLYAHFLHTPASVTRYAALITGLRWSCSAHAKDIWTTPAWDKREKLAEMAWLVTCTAAGAEHLTALAPPARVTLLHHGLDLTRFASPPAKTSARPLQVLTVGRLVEKKGHDLLLAALAQMPPDLDWRLTVIGSGPEKEKLQHQAKTLAIAARLDWLGARSQEEVLAAYRRADLFVLASRIAADGDRDGLPNVLMEAQSQRVAVIATSLPGIEELVLAGETGLLVPPDDSAALAQALMSLLQDEGRRLALAAAGEARLRRHFDARPGHGALAARFFAVLQPPPKAA